MNTKSILALAITTVAVITVVVEVVGFEDSGDWGPLAREWVTRTYAAIAALGAWWLAGSGVKTEKDRGGVVTLWVCRGIGAIGAMWLAYMLYMVLWTVLDS